MYIHTPKYVQLYEAHTYNRNTQYNALRTDIQVTTTSSSTESCYFICSRILVKKKIVFSLTQNKEAFKQPPPSEPGYPAHLRNKKMAHWSLACSYCTTPGQAAQEVGWGQNPRGTGQAAALGAGETLWAIRRLDWEEAGLGYFCLSHNFLCQ